MDPSSDAFSILEGRQTLFQRALVVPTPHRQIELISKWGLPADRTRQHFWRLVQQHAAAAGISEHDPHLYVSEFRLRMLRDHETWEYIGDSLLGNESPQEFIWDRTHRLATPARCTYAAVAAILGRNTPSTFSASGRSRRRSAIHMACWYMDSISRTLGPASMA